METDSDFLDQERGIHATAQGDSFSLQVRKPATFALALMVVMVAVPMLLAVAIVSSWVMGLAVPKPSALLGLAVCAATAWYFCRLLSWNLDGTEFYSFTHDQCELLASTPRYMLKEEVIDLKGLTAEIEVIELANGYRRPEIGRLILRQQDKTIISNVKIDVETLRWIVESHFGFVEHEQVKV
jgi:hypothetical protein